MFLTKQTRNNKKPNRKEGLSTIVSLEPIEGFQREEHLWSSSLFGFWRHYTMFMSSPQFRYQPFYQAFCFVLFRSIPMPILLCF